MIVFSSMTRFRRWLPVLILWGLAASCGDPPATPGGSDAIAARLVSPHGAEGAAVLELTGRGLEGIDMPRGWVFTEGTGERMRAVLVAIVPGEIAFWIRTTEPDAAITTTVIEIADGSNRVRPSLDGYRVELDQ